MKSDVVVIGAGLSGLTAAALLAKRGLSVTVIDKSRHPGGSCGAFKRGGATFDQGSAMLYGFGEKGFNSHRFVMNCLEEPINILRHDLLYVVNYNGHRIRFWPDVDRFAEELAGIFPGQRDNIHRFYRDMKKLYRHVMEDNQTYTTADETDPKVALASIRKHPVSYIRFLSYLNRSAETLLRKYFTDPEIFNFFDKLTSTYCYATVEEAPAVLAAVMFVDNHVGGSYYPAGGTLFLPGKLEKSIEANGGRMMQGREVTEILFENGKPCGVLLEDGAQIDADEVVYSGTVWNLYGKLIGPENVPAATIEWARCQEPTYPSVVLYTLVDRAVIPEGTAPVEMLVGNPENLDESEVTAYLFSIDDQTLCPPDCHTALAIGPSFRTWNPENPSLYQEQKEQETKRLLSVMENRFPGFSKAVRYMELATPATIERYCLKNGGAVAGPKQMLGQHMLTRLRTRTRWDSLFCCGESTVMGTGTPTVTVSGVSAANAILKKRGLAPFVYSPDMKNVVRMVPKPYTPAQMEADTDPAHRDLILAARRCRYCENPECSGIYDIPGILRRISVENLEGAKRRLDGDIRILGMPEGGFEALQKNCVLAREGKPPVELGRILGDLSRD